MRPIIEIVRLETGPEGTFGVLLIHKEIHGFTLEPPERFNRPNVSAIAAGQYLCRRYASPSYGDTLMVHDVPERSAILFHPGNVVGNTAGCILVGSEIGKLKGDRAVLNSGRTFREFMGRLSEHRECHLTIRRAY